MQGVAYIETNTIPSLISRYQSEPGQNPRHIFVVPFARKKSTPMSLRRNQDTFRLAILCLVNSGPAQGMPGVQARHNRRLGWGGVEPPREASPLAACVKCLFYNPFTQYEL